MDARHELPASPRDIYAPARRASAVRCNSGLIPAFPSRAAHPRTRPNEALPLVTECERPRSSELQSPAAPVLFTPSAADLYMRDAPCNERATDSINRARFVNLFPQRPSIPIYFRRDNNSDRRNDGCRGWISAGIYPCCREMNSGRRIPVNRAKFLITAACDTHAGSRRNKGGEPSLPLFYETREYFAFRRIVTRMFNGSGVSSRSHVDTNGDISVRGACSRSFLYILATQSCR